MTDRGIRNNNPGNLEGDTKWQGVVAHDGVYIVFDTPDNGLRALAIDLVNQQKLHGLHTVGAIITKFAPPPKNDTAAYIAVVCKHIGCKPDEILDLDDPVILGRFIEAIVAHENDGYAYSQLSIATAVAAALKEKTMTTIPAIPAPSSVQTTATAGMGIVFATGAIDYVVTALHMPPMSATLEGGLAAGIVALAHLLYKRLTA